MVADSDVGPRACIPVKIQSHSIRVVRCVSLVDSRWLTYVIWYDVLQSLEVTNVLLVKVHIALNLRETCVSQSTRTQLSMRCRPEARSCASQRSLNSLSCFIVQGG